mgnify:FL=1
MNIMSLMSLHFEIKGRLGNAIFRYLACSVLSINFDLEYKETNGGNIEITDEYFNNISEKLLIDEKINLPSYSYKMSNYYQHDQIYKKFKKQILSYILSHPRHTIITDGVNAGDRNYEYFKILDLVITPKEFKKIYKNVLHVRLEDFVTNKQFISTQRIIKLFNTGIVKDFITIVCKQPTTIFEQEYLKELDNYFKKQKITVTFEHNDTLSDYYIMKEAEILICSKSTLSWCSAFFSDRIKLCFLPDYKSVVNMSCKKPIDNTILY